MIDAHCHVDQYKNPLMVAKEAEAGGIVTIAVTSLPEHFELGHQALLGFRRVRLALGFHPMLADRNYFDEALFRTLASKTSYIGEIGLDYSSKDKSANRKQSDILKKVLRIINDRPRFISLHSRRAESDLFDHLTNFEIQNAVFHWYSGPLGLIDKVVDAGHYFSVNTSMIKSRNGQKIIDRIPPDRILTETDGPYIKVRGRMAEPKDVSLILSYLKDAWDMQINEVENRISINFRSIIGPLHRSNKRSNLMKDA